MRRRRGRVAAEVDRLRARRPAADDPAGDRPVALRRQHGARLAHRRRAPGGLAHDHAPSRRARARAAVAAATVGRCRTRRCWRPSAGATRYCRACRGGILDAALLRDAACMESYAGDAKLPLPRPMLRPALPLTAKLMAKSNKADDEKAQADLAALPGAAGAHRRVDRRRRARRRAAQRGRPADRQLDPPAEDDRGRAAADRRPTRPQGTEPDALV